MTDEKWQEIIGHIKDKFEVLDERTEALPEDAGPGTIDTIEFTGPLGKMRLERTTQPRVIDKKTLGSRRIGSETKVSYVYSDTEKSHKFRALRWDEVAEDWVELKMESEAMTF